MVSVIVPVYNVEKYLRECLDSICGQTYADIEVILVDDGSTDTSPIICKEYAARDRRFKVIHRPNCGPSEARNSGIKISTGSHIMFVDSDDIISPLTIELLLKLAEEEDADIVTAPFFEFSDSDKKEFSERLNRKSAMRGKEAALTMLYQSGDSLGLTNSPCGKLFRRSFWGDFKFTKEMLYEDLELLPMVTAAARSVVATDSIVYGYRRNNASRMGTFSSRRFDALTACNTLAEHFAADPELSRAAEDRRLSAAFNMLMLMGRHRFNEPARIDECCAIIRRQRRNSLWNKHVRFRNKAGIILSYIIGIRHFAHPFFARFLKR